MTAPITDDSEQEFDMIPPTDDSPQKEDRSYAHTASRKEENEIFYDLSSVHPLADFDEVAFIDLLEHSLSLSVSEKKRVVDSIPTLSQFQIDELIKVFVDEREEFKKLLAKEGDVIKDLAIKAREGWMQLR
jgi:hypothetical protein